MFAGGRLWIAALALAACGRLGFEPCPETCGSVDRGSTCTDDRECATGHCADGVCCDSACAGTCDSCTTGTCMPVAAACTGDCASCVASDGGFSCAPVPGACTGACGSGTCGGGGNTFTCDFGTCCATAIAPNLAGSCAMGPAVVLADGCNFEYDYSSWNMASNFVELQWDVEQCQHGTWVSIDSGADAVPCSGCTHDTRNTWSDTCGNATMMQTVCP